MFQNCSFIIFTLTIFQVLRGTNQLRLQFPFCWSLHPMFSMSCTAFIIITEWYLPIKLGSHIDFQYLCCVLSVPMAIHNKISWATQQSWCSWRCHHSSPNRHYSYCTDFQYINYGVGSGLMCRNFVKNSGRII